MKLWKYKNYDEYVKVQTEGNIAKLKNVWINEETIKAIHKLKPFTSNIICHGTRNGQEQKLFKKYFPAAFVVGTEISHTATQFPDTIQHDFHEVKEDYVDKFDVVYSNSFDHSYDPQKCLETWIGQLKKSGFLCIDVMTGRENVMRELDPLEISHEELNELLLKDFNMVKVINETIVRPRGANSILVVFKK